MTTELEAQRPNQFWLPDGWLAGAGEWAVAQMESHSFAAPERPAIIHNTAWSAVARFSAGEREIFLKVIAPRFRHEIPLTLALSREFPQISPKVIASDLDLGWLLMESGGERLREAVHGSQLVQHWLKLLPVYAGLQISWSARAEVLLRMGVPDRMVARIEREYPDLIDEAVRAGSVSKEGLTHQEIEALRALRPEVERAVDALMESSVREGLDHGDLHDGNVFFDQGQYSFIDWGDAGVSFPFFSLRTVEVSIENCSGELALLANRRALREAYLSPWIARAGLSWDRAWDLMAASEQVWSIGAALRWRRAIEALPPRDREQYGHVLPSLLRELIQAADQAPVQ